MDKKQAILRSWMFVPGDREWMIERVFGLSVDAVMMDLEDGVAPAEKDKARRQIAASLDRVEPKVRFTF